MRINKKLFTIFVLSLVVKICFATNDNLTLPHKFTSGNTISSSEINNNFLFVSPYYVKSNGTKIGFYFISNVMEYEGKIFFNGTYRSSVDMNGNLYRDGGLSYQDSNCSSPIAITNPGAVFKTINRSLSTPDNFVYNDYAHYVPINAQPLFDQSDVGVSYYYDYDMWSNPPQCRQRDVSSYSLNYYLLIPNDPNVTKIQNSYATPITIGK